MKKVLSLFSIVLALLSAQSCGKIKNDLNDFESNEVWEEDKEITIDDWLGGWEVTWDRQLKWYVDNQGLMRAEIVLDPISYYIEITRLTSYTGFNCMIYGLIPNDLDQRNKERGIEAMYDGSTHCLDIYALGLGGGITSDPYRWDFLWGVTSSGLVADTDVEDRRIRMYSMTIDGDKANSKVYNLNGEPVLSMGIYTWTENDEVYPTTQGYACMSTLDYPVYYPAGTMTWTKL